MNIEVTKQESAEPPEPATQNTADSFSQTDPVSQPAETTTSLSTFTPVDNPSPGEPAPITSETASQPAVHPTIPLELPSGKKSLIKSPKLWGGLAAALIIVIAATFLLMPHSSRLSSTGKASINVSLPLIARETSSPKTYNIENSLSSGTDNTSLNSDLSNISSSMNQENNDKTSASNSLNDSQQQIAIPTN